MGDCQRPLLLGTIRMSHKSINLADIVILPNRQRQEYEPNAMEELRASIEERGLIHAPVLRRVDASLVLVAGERRIRAIKDLFALGAGFLYDGVRYEADTGTIPYTDLGELSRLDAEEAELDENLRRKDLTWQEHAAAVERLHKLRTEQKRLAADRARKEFEEECEAENAEHRERLGPAFGSSVIGAAHTIAETAEEVLGQDTPHARETIRQELVVAKHLNNPLIANAKSANEAFKLLKREEERKQHLALAATVGANLTSSSHTLLLGNCLEHMKALGSKFDVIITDPPYGMDAQNFGDGGGQFAAIDHQYKDSLAHWQDLMLDWSRASFYVTKPQAHAYICCDIDQWQALKSLMEAAGWYVFRTPIINKKTSQGRVPLPDRGPRRQYEILMYCIKGKKQTNAIYPDMMETTLEENFGHGAQKPVQMYENLLMRSAKPGDHVLDSFCGTGPVFPACHQFRCFATGIEMSEVYYGLSAKRLQALDTQGLGELPL